MSAILYYSTKCRNCDKILSELARTELQKEIHFVCVDKRVVRNGNTYVILETDEEILLPTEVTRVPALLILADNRIIFGNDIYNMMENRKESDAYVATDGNMEPSEFSFSSNNQSNFFSSFDDDSESQIGGCYASASYDNVDKIDTPPEDYKADKLDDSSMKEYESKRNSGISL